MVKRIFFTAALLFSSMALAALPAPEFRIAQTTVTVHFDGEVESVMRWVNPLTGVWKQIDPVHKGDQLLYTFDQYVSQRLELTVGGVKLDPIVNPGERIEVRIDAAGSVHYDSGDFMALNNELSTLPFDRLSRRRIPLSINRGLKVPVKSIEAYVEHMVKAAQGAYAEIEEMPLSGAAKEVLRMDVNMLAMGEVANMESGLQVVGFGNGIKLNNNGDKLSALYPMDVPALAYGTEFGYEVPLLAIAANDPSLGGWLGMGSVVAALRKAEEHKPITDAERATVDNNANVYFAELLSYIEEKTNREYDAAMGSGTFKVNETPAVADPAAVVEAIAAQYKGQVVFIDFWATWCGPCLAGMRTMREIKPWMKEQGVVSVYVTDHTSPEQRWTTMLPEIGGEHFRLTREQAAAAYAKYGIAGIPYYMIIDKGGNIVFQQSGYPGNDAIMAELGKVL